MKLYRKKPVVVEAYIFDSTNTDDVIFQKKRGHVKSDGWFIDTLEGMMRVNIGDYIITGVKGEKYPCKPDIFKQTYVEVR